MLYISLIRAHIGNRYTFKYSERITLVKILPLILETKAFPCRRVTAINRPFAGSGHGINYTGTQMTQWDFQNKGKSTWTGHNSFVLEVPLRHLRPSVIYSVPCDRILQRAYLPLLTSRDNLLIFSSSSSSFWKSVSAIPQSCRSSLSSSQYS